MRWLAALFTFVWCLPAWAGVVLVPSPPLVGDGSTPASVRFYVDDGSKIRVKADSGKLGPAVGGPDGVWTVPFTPPRVGSTGTIPFKVTAGKAEYAFEVPVVPVFSGTLNVSFDPPVLASTGTATIKIEPEGSSPIAAQNRNFLLVASAGTVEAVTPTGSGAWVARYTPPKGMTAPLSVVFGAADAAAPDKVYGTAVLPVTVKRSVTVDVAPGSTNVLKVGSRQYGPLVAAPSGKVAFDIDLDPREPKGDLRSINTDTSKADKEIDLPVAGAVAVNILPLPSSIPAQADLAVPVRLAIVRADGEPLTAGTAVKLTASSGTVTAPVLDRSLHVATFTPPTTPGEVTLTVEVEGVKATRKIKLVGSVPTITVTAPDVTKTGTSLSVTARVKDAQGTGVIGRAPTLTVVGATASGSPKDNKDGSYTYTYKLSSKTNFVRVYAAPAVEVSTMPAARLVGWPAASTVAANGTDVVTVTVLAVDAFGLPVPNVALTLGAPKGDGSVPPSAKTDARGMARIPFTAGKTPGVASVRAEGAGLVTEVPLFQAKDGAAPMLPVGGSPSDEAIVAKWQAASPELRVMREGFVPPSGPPALVAISTVPPYTTPGAAILVNIRVTDSAGMGVGGKKLAITAAPATVGQITDNRDGTYAVPLQLPAGQDGPIDISVGADSATGALTLPTLAQVGAMQPTAATGGRSTGGAATGGKSAGGRTGGGGGGMAASSGEWATLRLGADLVNSRGSYAMESDAKAQLLSSAGYSTPGAGFFGLGVEAVWLPLQQSWGGLGVDARAKAQVEWFNLGETPYLSFQRDVMVGARYRRGLVGILSIEGSLTAHYTTGSVFQYEDAARTKAVMLNKPLYGARLGAIGSIETDRLYTTLEIAETFAPFPIDTHIEAIAAYRFSDGPLTLRFGAGWDLRTMEFEADGDGENGTANVEQSQFTIRVGAGTAF